MTKLHEVRVLGQAIWLDYIRRAFLASGDLAEWVAKGLAGVTSNPSIFEKAIAGSGDYDDALHLLVEEGRSPEEIYEALAVADIQMAADILHPVYEATDGLDGYVSLEVSPELARDTAGTISEARRLHALIDRPNLMIKVPATPEGLPAIETLLGEGLNINVTLVFSVPQYQEVAESYLRGLERRLAAGGDLSRVASVASFFLSRIDVALDERLEAMGAGELKGSIAIAQAKVAYARFLEIFSGDRWSRISERGGRVQRLLWASTGTKSPELPDTLYVDGLIGANTVNTLPPATLHAFLHHGVVQSTLADALSDANQRLQHLDQLGLDLEAVTSGLLLEGVAAFERSFRSLRDAIAQKREMLLSGWAHHRSRLGPYEASVEAALDELAEADVLDRIWWHDHTVWSPEPDEITNRLGWLHSPEMMRSLIDRLEEFAGQARAAGIESIVVLGMGGSSLAPDVFRTTFGAAAGDPDLWVLDTTSSDAILQTEEQIDLASALFLVSTKSGTTVETLSLFRYFYHRVSEAVGRDRAGDHFVAITDPGSPLIQIADRHGFRAKFINDPNIGGRYSALSYFGLVPAALIGLDLGQLLDRALAMISGCEACVGVHENPGAWFGAVLGELARSGRNKLTVVASPRIQSFGDWIEQLIAESTGKSGRGILPVVHEDLGPPSVYGPDRLFVALRLEGDHEGEEQLELLAEAGHPVVTFHLHDRYDLGGQMFLWEFATAVAGHRLGINPFDQPNVEAAKLRAKEMVAAYQKRGELPKPSPTLQGETLDYVGDALGESPEEALLAFLAHANPGDPKSGAGRSYVALQAYLPPGEALTDALQTLRLRIRDHTRLATTLGYGPRFLHSTGQLHKGDAGHGLFIQLSAPAIETVFIPEEAGQPGPALSFGVLIEAQALGDRQALLDAGRAVARYQLHRADADLIGRLAEALG